MYKTYLRKVNDSAVLFVPPVILELLNLHGDEEVGLTVKDEKLIVEPFKTHTPKYFLEELRTQYDSTPEISPQQIHRSGVNLRGM